MLIERRCYSLMPGKLETFWKAQSERGCDPEQRPILARVIGYFSSLTGQTDEVIHLYRYDSYEDWFARLHGSYQNPANDTYFATVRNLMLAQTNEFLTPVPVGGLSALIGGKADWLPSDGPRWPVVTTDAAIVSETVYQMRPGLMTSIWKQVQSNAEGDSGQPSNMIGYFSAHVGQQHRTYVYQVHQGPLGTRGDPAWIRESGFHKVASANTESISVRWLEPSPLSGLSPLFRSNP